MLKATVNPFDIIKQLPAQFGTNPTPNWLLVWHRSDSTWSAADLDSVDDLLEVSLDANLEAICTLGPEAVMHVLQHAQPDVISASLHQIATHWRPKAIQISIADFAPDQVELFDGPVEETK